MWNLEFLDIPRNGAAGDSGGSALIPDLLVEF